LAENQVFWSRWSTDSTLGKKRGENFEKRGKKRSMLFRDSSFLSVHVHKPTNGHKFSFLQKRK